MAPVAIRNMFRLRQESCHVRPRTRTRDLLPSFPPRHRPSSICARPVRVLQCSRAPGPSLAHGGPTSRAFHRACAAAVHRKPASVHRQAAETHVEISYSIRPAAHRRPLTDIRDWSDGARHSSPSECERECYSPSMHRSSRLRRRVDGPVSTRCLPAGSLEDRMHRDPGPRASIHPIALLLPPSPSGAHPAPWTSYTYTRQPATGIDYVTHAR